MRNLRIQNIESDSSNINILKLVSCLIVIFTLNLNGNKLANIIGFLSIIFVLIYSIFNYFIYISKHKIIFKYDLILMCFAQIYLLILIINIGSFTKYRAIINIFEFFSLAIFTIVLSNVNYDNIKIADKLTTINFIIFIVISIVTYLNNSNSIYNSYRSIYQNPNSLGIIAMSFFGTSILFLKLTNLKRYYFFSIAFLILTILSKSRSALIGILFSFIIYLIYNIISKNKRRWRVFFIFFLLSLSIIVVLYINITKFDFYYKLATTIYEFTGKNILSGRQIVWSHLINLVKNKLWLGYGSGAQLSNYSNIQLSAHNLFLQILFQNGLIGLVTFIIFLFIVWNNLYSSKQNQITRLSSSLFCGILFLNLFEVTLIQNNMAAALIQWFIISIGLNKAKMEQINTK